MRLYSITRNQILSVLENTLKPLDFVFSMWEAGAASFDRIDQWSDIDLQVIAQDERSLDVLNLIEQALESISPIELMIALPMPTWHGYPQAFFRLRDASPFHMLDIVVMHHSVPSKWQTLKIPIPAASNGAFRDFPPTGTGLLVYSFRASPGGTCGSGHSSHQQAGRYSGNE